MIRVSGTIAEWNPFHNGHSYFISKARQQMTGQVLVAVMSGNYTQRGELAITHKYWRAQAGLRAGVDLVVELPVWLASQSADYFAQAAVEILASLGASELLFGTENQDFSHYQYLTEWLIAHPQSLNQGRPASQSYAMNEVQSLYQLVHNHRDLQGLEINFEGKANNLLAFAYAKANARLSHPMRLTNIWRRQAQHGDVKLASDHDISSGTAIRQALVDVPFDQGRAILSRYASPEMLKAYETGQIGPDLAAYYQDVNYLLTMQPDQLQAQLALYHPDSYQRLRHTAGQASSLAELLALSQHRSLSQVALQRQLLMLALQVTKDELTKLRQQPTPILILAASQAGRQLLKQLKKQENQPKLISRAGRDYYKSWPLIDRSERYYYKKLGLDNHDMMTRPPIFTKD
ncbi:hypothetical protein AWM75_06505 [Aerococcus urinaehominis]|uniref:tRNA(Met) cytidine acetate ligase n=1 Tax=Aerococcus urinaehominis TaxID=128944 RepID=A0A109RH60_9LACT|nr:nucleotidyltransferase family protein [Aerococcus urinaehominis]AMB99651.1 hypothetical protein AWM75_06505 [Aerococcus urinaehominis]SDL88990.1 Predicted nucleotidyltransferase [Aerococcus urinaehominis]